ncbi:hypothetical protein HCN44_003802, partial [Aphidius gifuensis]
HEKAALLMKPKQVQNIIYAAKKNYHISAKESLEQQAETIKQHPKFNEYFRICMHPENQQEGTILFFAHKSALNRLNNAKELFFDGNFKIVPTHPQSMQTWNILMREHGAENTETSLVGFAWCTNANHGTYCRILNYLKEQAPRLESNLETIHTDFEQAAILAFHYVFPYVRIIGCWFHFSQAITNHWDDCELIEKLTKEQIELEIVPKRAPREILYLCRNIPLLPPEKIEIGLKILSNLIDKYIVSWPALGSFRDYVIHQWAGKAHLLSCFGNSTRTNNNSETFNRSLLRRIGGKNPILMNFSH